MKALFAITVLLSPFAAHAYEVMECRGSKLDQFNPAEATMVLRAVRGEEIARGCTANYTLTLREGQRSVLTNIPVTLTWRNSDGSGLPNNYQIQSLPGQTSLRGRLIADGLDNAFLDVDQSHGIANSYSFGCGRGR